MSARPASPLGKVPDSWGLVQLKEIAAKVKSGATPKGGESSYLPARERFALIRSQNVFNRRFNESGLAFINEKQAGELAGAQVQAGDVLLNITGDGITFGRSALVPERILPACVNQHVMLIRPRTDACDAGFLLSYLTHPHIKRYIESFNAGGSRRAITKGHIESFAVPLPPLREQRAIAHILGTLDDKIELNRRMNQTLEAMAQALFKSWFVDPARDGPPKGWREVPLPEAVELNPPYRLRKGEAAPYLDMGSMPTHAARALAVQDREFGSGMRFMNGDTLVARITPCLENGKTCFVDFLAEGEVGWGSTEYIVMRPRRPLPPEFAYFLARTDGFRTFAISNMTGTTGRQRVPADCFFNFALAVPPADEATRFGQFARAVFAQMRARDTESHTLTQLRDALLPKLLSGELRVAA